MCVYVGYLQQVPLDVSDSTASTSLSQPATDLTGLALSASLVSTGKF